MCPTNIILNAVNVLCIMWMNKIQQWYYEWRLEVYVLITLDAKLLKNLFLFRRQTFPILVAASLVFRNLTFIQDQMKKSHFYILSFLLLFFIHICCHFQSVKVNSMQKKATEKKKLIQDVCLLFDGFLGNVTVNVTKFRTSYWNKWIEWEGETKREKDENTRQKR